MLSIPDKARNKEVFLKTFFPITKSINLRLILIEILHAHPIVKILSFYFAIPVLSLLLR